MASGFWASLKERIFTKWFLASLLVFAIVEAIIIPLDVDLQWQWIIIYGFLMISISPIATTPAVFFRGGLEANDRSNGSLFILACSAFISWVFAKSINNSSKLGASFGFMGGVAYSSWYISFLSVAIVVYRLRLKGYKSLPEAINHRYGNLACMTYFLTVLYRLYQEVWSNSMVVAEFYGPVDSKEWWWSAILSTAVPLVYAMLGGMRTSLLSDVFQAVLAVVFLIVVLSVIKRRTDDFDCGTRNDCNLIEWNPVPSRERVSLEGGVDLVIVGLLQGAFSYGFMDPVLTDRAFLLEPKTMVKAYTLGGTIAAIFIMFFSLLGVYGNMLATLDVDEKGDAIHASDVKGGSPGAVADTVSTAFFSIVNIIFITSSISTLDSTFTSVSKAMGPELTGLFTIGRPNTLQSATSRDVLRGRVMMLLVAVVGTLTLLSDQSELNATTVSGTVVLGLGWPIIFLEFLDGYRPLAFHMSYWLGACIGICYTIEGQHPNLLDFSQITIGEGSYKQLLGWNVLSSCLTLLVFIIFSFENFKAEDLPSAKSRRSPPEENDVYDEKTLNDKELIMTGRISMSSTVV